MTLTLAIAAGPSLTLARTNISFGLPNATSHIAAPVSQLTSSSNSTPAPTGVTRPSSVTRAPSVPVNQTPRVLKQWHGWNYSGPLLISSAIITNLSNWHRVWSVLQVPSMPDVDFSHAIAVIVTKNLEPGLGYYIQFGKPRREAGVLIVPYCIIPPRVQIQIITYPWAAELIRARDAKVEIRNTCAP